MRERRRPGLSPAPEAAKAQLQERGSGENGAASGAAPPDTRVLVGRFGAAQGVRGEIRIKSFTGDPLALAGYGPLADKTGAKTYIIQRARLLREDMLVAKIDGIDDREAAQALTNQDLYIAREKLPPPDEEEFYIADLIGMRAVAPDGVDIGVVVDVVNYGAGDLLEIAPPVGQTLLTPFTKVFATDVDFADRRITVILPTLEAESEQAD